MSTEKGFDGFRTQVQRASEQGSVSTSHASNTVLRLEHQNVLDDVCRARARAARNAECALTRLGTQSGSGSRGPRAGRRGVRALSCTSAGAQASTPTQASLQIAQGSALARTVRPGARAHRLTPHTLREPLGARGKKDRGRRTPSAPIPRARGRQAAYARLGQIDKPCVGSKGLRARYDERWAGQGSSRYVSARHSLTRTAAACASLSAGTRAEAKGTNGCGSHKGPRSARGNALI